MKVLALLVGLSVLFLQVKSNPCRFLNENEDCVIQCLEGASSYTISGLVQSVYDDVNNINNIVVINKVIAYIYFY